MEIFKLIVDKRVELWRRDHVNIEAESLEEAINKALNNEYICEDSNYFYDTEYVMEPDQVYHSPAATIEVMDIHYNILKDNYGGGQLR